MTETRLVSATGGEKGQKASQLSSMDAAALLYLGEVSGFGAKKYAAFNYLNGYSWRLSYDALLRHVLAGLAGEDFDLCPTGCPAHFHKCDKRCDLDHPIREERTCRDHSGLLHVAHAAWHCLALVSFFQRGIGEDDRYKQPDPVVEVLGWTPDEIEEYLREAKPWTPWPPLPRVRSA